MEGALPECSGVHPERVLAHTQYVTERFGFLVGETVEQIWLWGPVRFVLRVGERPEPSVYVDVQRCSFTGPDGDSVEIDASTHPGEAAPMLVLLHQRVVEASESEGVLTLRFDRGAELRALPDPSFESWTVVGDGGRVFQSMPGGKVDSW